jgi:hypothetical protein
MRADKHECAGAGCPHVVDTGEALVCSLTGMCVGEIMMASYDYLSSSTKQKVCDAQLSAIYKSDNPGSANNTDDTKHKDLHGECYRVVKKLLGREEKNSNEERNAGALKVATKSAQKVFKQFDGKRRKLLPAICEFVDTFRKTQQTGEASFQDAWLNAVTERCAHFCALCIRMKPEKNGTMKIKIEYMCVAVLYMLRMGVVVKGVVLVAKDDNVARALPKLNILNSFQFAKSKYTKAERFVRQALQEAIFTQPMHSICV